MQGFSSDVVELLLGGNRESTNSSYQSAWNIWFHWCVRSNQDPLHPAGIGTVLEFLTELSKSGKAYRTINVIRSMLSSSLEKIDGMDVGKHPLVMRLMRGIYIANPPQPKYTGMWDTDVVLSYLETLGANAGLSLAVLSKKTAVLLALTSLFRVSELAAIDHASVVFTEQGVSFSLSKPRKSQRRSPLHVHSLKRISPPSIICPVACLETYDGISKSLRNPTVSYSCFLSLKPPHCPVGASTLARWIKEILREAGIDTSIYSAHSTRGASASKAASAGIPVESILKSGSWSSESVFARHYRRPIDSPSVAQAVLQPVVRFYGFEVTQD